MGKKQTCRFRDLPLGARFRYQKGGPVWAIVDRSGCGRVVRWEGAGGASAGECVCSFMERDEDVDKAFVIVDEDDDEFAKKILAVLARCELEVEDPQCLGAFEVLEKIKAMTVKAAAK